MNKPVWHFVMRSAEAMTLKPKSNILEVGSAIVIKKQRGLLVRNFFRGHHYFGIDKQKGYNVDKVMDATKTPFKKGTFDVIICCDVLEHVPYPLDIIKEINRILKVGGYLCLTVPFMFEIHDHPDDFWRFTPSCMEKVLFKNFRTLTMEMLIDKLRNYSEVLGLAQKVS